MRELIIKYPEVEIWDKDLNKWDSKDFEIFENLKNGILPIKEEIKNDKKLKGSKVIRISDSKEYQSISQCMRENGFCSQKMNNLLKEETFYKKVKIMKTLQELQVLILQWAKEKDLLKFENAPKQRLKLLEEVGETAAAILKNKPDEIKDGIGDIFVVLVILNAQIDGNLEFDIDGFEKSKETDIYEILKNIAYVNNGSLYSELSVLNYACNLLNLDLTECANLAWNEIKDRKGNTIDGVFIKSN